ncbi:hypothetical protein QJS04_geneDACA010376 [Acorus gramineus]|uniref:Uncharacterized protein n=1 Tax=Acorus gramineus TaxID=55184 RepID=A0AAV9A544_ACOGR|nr:hypothetical protein QJS04_geneDACA010376 [Acorus gramineus]
MGRGRGKGKRLTVVPSHGNPGNGGEEPLPAYKRRGRPTKPLKDDIDDEVVEKIEEEDVEDVKQIVVKETKKRRKSPQAKENVDSTAEGNGVGMEDSTKPNGFRQNGSRRKSKPHRAAEAGVDCN